MRGSNWERSVQVKCIAVSHTILLVDGPAYWRGARGTWREMVFRHSLPTPSGAAPHHAHAYASTRGSAPALSTPFLSSITMPAFEPSDHGHATLSL